MSTLALKPGQAVRNKHTGRIGVIKDAYYADWPYVRVRRKTASGRTVYVDWQKESVELVR